MTKMDFLTGLVGFERLISRSASRLRKLQARTLFEEERVRQEQVSELERKLSDLQALAIILEPNMYRVFAEDDRNYYVKTFDMGLREESSVTLDKHEEKRRYVDSSVLKFLQLYRFAFRCFYSSLFPENYERNIRTLTFASTHYLSAQEYRKIGLEEEAEYEEQIPRTKTVPEMFTEPQADSIVEKYHKFFKRLWVPEITLIDLYLNKKIDIFRYDCPGKYSVRKLERFPASPVYSILDSIFDEQQSNVYCIRDLIEVIKQGACPFLTRWMDPDTEPYIASILEDIGKEVSEQDAINLRGRIEKFKSEKPEICKGIEKAVSWSYSWGNL